MALHGQDPPKARWRETAFPRETKLPLRVAKWLLPTNLAVAQLGYLYHGELGPLHIVHRNNTSEMHL